ncbi:MAG: hypothetical protein ACO3GP_08680, partial [Candidatus Limnocylindrus sp.]
MSDKWTETEIGALLELVQAHGADAFQRHAKATGRSPEAVRMYIQRVRREDWQDAMAVHKARRIEAAKEEATPSEKKLTQITDWWDTFRPVTIATPPKRSTKTAETGLTIVASDFHFPLQDDAAVSIFLETVRRLKPEQVILNGDLPDLLALSRYPKDVRHNWGLADEATAYTR